MDDVAGDFEDLALRQQSGKGKRGGGGNRRGGGGGGGGAGGSKSREVGISRALSRLLRHQAESAGVQLDREGYAKLDKVVSTTGRCYFVPATELVELEDGSMMRAE
jgi:2'-phosphotransferase